MKNNYVLLIKEAQTLKEKIKVIRTKIIQSENDIRWYLSELYSYIDLQDEESYIAITGMGNHLTTTSKKKELSLKKNKDKETKKTKNNSSDVNVAHGVDEQKKELDKKWVKQLYRAAVKRCHPDTIKIKDEDYKNILIDIYKEINEAYNNLFLDDLMISSYKVHVKPDIISKEHITILEESKSALRIMLIDLQQDKNYLWSLLSKEEKELFFKNFFKQKGIKISDVKVFKDIMSKKPPRRKVGKRPVNLRKSRVNKKKMC